MNNVKFMYYVVGAIAIIVLVIAVITLPSGGPDLPGPGGPSDGGGDNGGPTDGDTTAELGGVERFTSVEEFKEYLDQAQAKSELAGFGGGVGLPTVMRSLAADGVDLDSMAFSESAALGAPQAAPDRVSGTNVQVIGIDEPDIVKTDGRQIYFSSPNFYIEPFPRPLIFDEGISFESEALVDRLSIAPPPRQRGGVKNITAFPPADLDVVSTLDRSGDLLLHDDNLVVFSGNEIFGYDVSDPASPIEQWDIALENRTQVVTSRLYDNKIYVVTRTWLDRGRPCPYSPLSLGGQSLSIPCIDIYHPHRPVPTDSTFTVMTLDPTSGEVLDKTSFVGSQGQSIVSMSRQAIYVTYQDPGDFVAFTIDFFRENRDLIPGDVVNRLERLQTYELSSQARLLELRSIINEFESTLDDDDELRLSNELTNRMDSYGKAHMRELERLGIVKISTDKLDVVASGVVPGSPLNQFSLDEYEGHLRVATTIDPRRNAFLGFSLGGLESENDVYVLDDDLNVTSSIQGLGLTERVFAVRFVQDKGYVVTFRQIDPFYVLDLSNPREAKLSGELKIPGFSSYLHPITKDQILGIGKEGSQVKLSMFDVSDPENPTESGKYMLDEFWSEVQSTHHAFLLDPKHEIFFLPGGKGGYIFSYDDERSLSLHKAVGDIRARRAVFINDYLYVIGDDKLVVLSETDWERVNQLSY